MFFKVLSHRVWNTPYIKVDHTGRRSRLWSKAFYVTLGVQDQEVVVATDFRTSSSLFEPIALKSHTGAVSLPLVIVYLYMKV